MDERPTTLANGITLRVSRPVPPRFTLGETPSLAGTTSVVVPISGPGGAPGAPGAPGSDPQTDIPDLVLILENGLI